MLVVWQEASAIAPTFLPAVPRLIAIGDLHGDLDKAKRAFRVGGLIDANDRWCGGSTTVVQVYPSSHLLTLLICYALRIGGWVR